MIWHYTTRAHLAQIIESGYLRLTPRKPEIGQIAGVWFTESPDWEPTAAKKVGLQDKRTGEVSRFGITPFGMLEKLMGIARIGVEETPAYLTFRQYEQVCSPEWAAHLIRAWGAMAREIDWVHKPSGPAYWRVKLSTVPVEDFAKVQVYQAGNWRDV